MSVLLPILVPERFTPSVKVGDHVMKDQVIATAPTERLELTIDIPQIFSVPRRQARKLIRKNPGDSISQGEVIAVKKGFFGKDTRLISEGSGTVKRYERDTGCMIIIGTDDGEFGDESNPQQITAPLEGAVTQVDIEKIVLESDTPVLVAKHGAGGSVQGELVVLPSAYLSHDITSEVLPHEITSLIAGRIVLGGVFDREDLVKCTSLGVVGIIGGEIDKEDIHYLLGKNMLLPLIQVDEHVWKSVAKAHSKQVFLDADSGTILIL